MRFSNFLLISLIAVVFIALGWLWFASVDYDPRCLVVECRIVKK